MACGGSGELNPGGVNPNRMSSSGIEVTMTIYAHALAEKRKVPGKLAEALG